MSGLFGSTTIKGNRLTDFAGQTATVGIPIPFGYGKFPVDGNVIWTAGIPTEHVTKKKQGKGGVKTEEYTYTLSYAIAFCAGPIFGFLTIKRDGKVVYTSDPNAPIDDLAYAAKWQQKATFYFGTRDQMPDSTIEAKEGAGQVSAFRDLAYIVVEDDDVTAGGGAVPSYTAVVIASPPEVYVTSKPYPVVTTDDLTVNTNYSNAALRDTLQRQNLTDTLGVGLVFISAELATPLVSAGPFTDEAAVSSSFVSAELRTTLRAMNTPVDKLTVGSSFVSGDMRTTLIQYTIPEPDQLQVSCQFIQGTLSS